jgi:uncharacterized protein YgbK (DUF1537 family)
MDTKLTTPQIVVIADDFTGGNDAGVSLACTGLRVDVAFELPYHGNADVLVVNSDSRALAARHAASRIEALVHDCYSNPHQLLLKKIDSTLRGNPGAELEAMMRSTGKQLAIVSPAFPDAGRTTVQGQCLVNGVPVTETEFASDPKTPVASADISMILQAQTTISCQSMSLSQFSHRLNQYEPDGPEIWVVDAQTDGCLDTIATLALAQKERPLLVGSAGICQALARQNVNTSPRCLLAMVGSMSEVAQRQIATVCRNARAESLVIDIENVLCGSPTHYLQQIINILSSGRHCIVHTCPDHKARHRIPELCARWQLTRPQLGEKVCHFLGVLTRHVLEAVTPDALYLSGGDVASAVAGALGARGFRITGCVAQCVPYGHFAGGLWQRPVMTKAGGFGDEATLLQVLNFIEEIDE